MPLEIRTLTGHEDVAQWVRAAATGFLRSPEVTDEEISVRSPTFELDRLQGAFDGGRCVATFRTLPQELTVPGGAVLPSCAVSAVTVSATHRRRGLLTRMMRDALSAAKERGDACASLIAAEYPIYGRYGFGPAAGCAEFEVDVARSGLDRRCAGPDDGGRVNFADADEVCRVGPDVHDRFRRGAQAQGAIGRDAHFWQRMTGRLRWPGDGFVPPFHVVYRDPDGVPQGLVSYTVDDHWEKKTPGVTLTVGSLTAATPAAERALWRFLLSVDWVTKVRSGLRPVDDVLPMLLPDRRAARLVAESDYFWLRPLDVPRMLEQRTYPVAGRLVFDLRDEAGLAGGRYKLDAGPDGSRCVTTRESPDLAMDIREFGSLHLGEESSTRLVTLGLVDEHRAGAAVLADALLRTARRPWCPDNF